MSTAWAHCSVSTDAQMEYWQKLFEQTPAHIVIIAYDFWEDMTPQIAVRLKPALDVDRWHEVSDQAGYGN